MKATFIAQSSWTNDFSDTNWVTWCQTQGCYGKWTRQPVNLPTLVLCNLVYQCTYVCPSWIGGRLKMAVEWFHDQFLHKLCGAPVILKFVVQHFPNRGIWPACPIYCPIFMTCGQINSPNGLKLSHVGVKN